MSKKIAIFIPARLNSERLPKKHLIPLNETGLTAWEITCKKMSKIKNAEVYALILESEKELVDICKKYNINVIFREYETTMVDAPLNFIFKDIKNIDCTHFMFLNPCVLNLKHETIELNIEKFKKSKEDYATSVKKFRNWVLNENSESLIDSIDYTKISTKNIPIRNQFAHCFHIFNKNNFFKDGLMLKENFLQLYVDESDVLVDLDDQEDLELAKLLYGKNHYE